MGFQTIIRRPPSKIEFTPQQEEEIRAFALQIAAAKDSRGKEKCLAKDICSDDEGDDDMNIEALRPAMKDCQ